MKLLIINQPYGNRGDESAHKALVRHLNNSYPDSEIETFVLENNKDLLKDIAVENNKLKYTSLPKTVFYNKALFFALNYNMSFLFYIHPTLKAIKKEIKSADLVICAPGGICMGGFQNWEHINLLRIAMKFKKPIAYFGRSIGPFPTGNKKQILFKKYSYKLMKYFGYFSLRDKKSEEIASQINIPFISTVDTAFLDSIKVNNIPLRVQKQIGNSNYIVFVPHLLTWHYAYRNISTDLLDRFYIGIINNILSRDDDTKILMLPQEHYFRLSDDKYYFTRLMEKINNDRIEVIDDMYGSDIQQSIIKDAKYVIGARYHSIVFAINNCRPFISLCYEHKMSGLLDTLNIKNRMVDITHIFNSEEQVDMAIKEVSLKIDTIHDCTKESLKWQKEAKTIALNGYNKLKEYIDSFSHS